LRLQHHKLFQGNAEKKLKSNIAPLAEKIFSKPIVLIAFE
jgi:hypothetical protein